MPDATNAKRPLSLGVIFLTLVIDLIGFSIIFPLAPHLIEYYLRVDGHTGALGWFLTKTHAVAHLLGKNEDFSAVLLGGVISSFFSILQFVFAPFWGSISDRRGRRGVLFKTVIGTAVGYLIWIFSGSFWLFIVSRIVSGTFSGNLSVATAAVADVTTRQERSRAMGIVGAAFGIGLVTGPMIGALTADINLLTHHPSLARFGVNPFSAPALISFALCLANVVWVYASFKETLSPEARAEAREPRLRNPLKAIFTLENAAVRQANFVTFVYSVAFVAMETSLTFLATDRFHFTTRQNGYLLGFLGTCSIITQGYIVRKLRKWVNEIRVLSGGLICTSIGLLCIGFAPYPWVLYPGLVFLATGAGLVNPSTSGLISLYSDPREQGRMLGIYRSLGSLARAVTPMVAGAIPFIFNYSILYSAAAVLALGAFGLSTTLPAPKK